MTKICQAIRFMGLVSIPLMQNSIDLWVISVPIDPCLLLTLKGHLSEQELGDLELFKDKILKDNAVVSRGALRSILSMYLGTDPNLLNIEKNEYGKPHILGSNIRFNVSHSGKYVLIAVSTNIELGVDIEQVIEDFDYSDIVDNYFTNNEKQYMRPQSITSLTAFYRAWTRKEACLKAVGKGLSIDLKDIEVTCSNELAKVVKFKGYGNDWQLLEIQLDPGYIVSVALQASHPYSINKLEFV